MADWRQELAEPRLIGSGVFRYFGLRIYNAELWASSSGFVATKPFALVLTYARSISRERFVDSSVNEIRRLMGDRLDAALLADWRQKMTQAFVDIREGEQMIAIFNPGRGVRFFHDATLTAQIDDPAFAAAFADIWLSPNTRDADLRRALLTGKGLEAGR